MDSRERATRFKVTFDIVYEFHTDDEDDAQALKDFSEQFQNLWDNAIDRRSLILAGVEARVVNIDKEDKDA